MVQCVCDPHLTDHTPVISRRKKYILGMRQVESLSDQTGSPRDLGRENGWLLGQFDNDSCPFLQNHVPKFHGRYMYFILWRLSYNIPRESVSNSVFDITCVDTIIRPFGFQNDSGMIVRLKAELVIGDPHRLSRDVCRSQYQLQYTCRERPKLLYDIIGTAGFAGLARSVKELWLTLGPYPAPDRVCTRK